MRTGRIVTKPQILAVTRHNFQKNPTRTKANAAPHDDFGIRRFGDVIVQHGRSTTMKPDGTKGDARRYLIVLQKQRGQWWVVGRETIPIDYKAQPESPEILAVQAKAKPSATNKIILGKEAEPEVEKEILRLSAVQNQAAGTGDSDNVTRDRLFADDIMWMSSTGHVQTKDEFIAGVKANFAKNPKRTVNKHDDFTVRQFGDTIIQLGRSNTINDDGSSGTSAQVHECLHEQRRAVVVRRARRDADCVCGLLHRTRRVTRAQLHGNCAFPPSPKASRGSAQRLFALRGGPAPSSKPADAGY